MEGQENLSGHQDKRRRKKWKNWEEEGRIAMDGHCLRKLHDVNWMSSWIVILSFNNIVCEWTKAKKKLSEYILNWNGESVSHVCGRWGKNGAGAVEWCSMRNVCEGDL